MQIHVAAGAIQDARGRILIAKRPDGVHQSGLWEFPGGKLEPGEKPEAALARELKEELGIDVLSGRRLIRVRHAYQEREVLLDVYRVDAYTGIPYGREGQPIAWVEPWAMDPDLFLAADRAVISALKLPSLYLITGEDPRNHKNFLDCLSAALERGIRLVQLRAHRLCDQEYASLAQSAFRLCEQSGARLLLNRDPLLAQGMPCHGLHLSARYLAGLAQRPVTQDCLVGASCHNADDLARAACLELDYALLSPVKATSSHPDAKPLGWEGFAELAEKAALPLYALGGLGTDDLDPALAYGAQGVAAIRAFWRRN